MDWLVRVFLCILKSSFTGSILILVVIGVLKIFNKKISTRVKNWIWILVLIKILIPVYGNADTNIFSILQENYGRTNQSDLIPDYNQQNAGVNYGQVSASIDENKDFRLILFKSMTVIWIAGFSFLTLSLIVSQLKFAKKTKDAACDIEIDNLIRKCNIKTRIPVYLCDDIKSPCISGVLRPRIYIPTYVLHMNDKNQLSYILLHELIHYKRKDLIYNFFGILALFLHWFNPFVWIAVKKMNLCRECACDACVLELLNEEENVEYGMTLLNLSKLYRVTRHGSQLPVFFETKTQIRDRIWLIKGFKKGSYKIKASAVLGCTVAAFVILTNNIPVYALNAENIFMDDVTVGWVISDGNWYYYDNHGVKLKNTVVEGHELGADGAMAELQPNAVPAKNTTQVSNQINRPDGWYINNQRWYYVKNHSYVTGWLNYNGTWFYLDKQGAMVTNTTLEIDGKQYEFSSNGEWLSR
ncbi:M56 family metallopeptidase [Lacrimispora sp. 38-1]|uniref:M56 family metallopeptidase n=1 Tax=Lacrimispora sp. 38-1 TaxID=3125778 RepID=UPI003CE9EE6E